MNANHWGRLLNRENNPNKGTKRNATKKGESNGLRPNAVPLTKVVTCQKDFRGINVGHIDAQRIEMGVEMTSNL